MTATRIVTTIATLLLATGCATPTTRVVCRPEIRNTPLLLAPPPPARDQVMVAASVGADPAQRTLGTITEEERTELLRAAGSPILPYSPGPAFDPTARTVVVERAVWGDGYAYGPRDPDWWTPMITTGATIAFMTAPFWGCWGWNFCGD